MGYSKGAFVPSRALKPGWVNNRPFAPGESFLLTADDFVYLFLNRMVTIHIDNINDLIKIRNKLPIADDSVELACIRRLVDAAALEIENRSIIANNINI